MNVFDLIKIIENARTGLNLIDARTGTGKSYSAAKAMFLSRDKVKRFFSITNFKKNLATDDLKRFYIDSNLTEEDFSREVCLLRSNADQMIKCLIGTDIPRELKTNNYLRLEKSVRLYKEAKDSMIRDILRERINVEERNYRQELKIFFKKKLGKISFEDKQAKIKKNYPWLINLYPAAIINEYKIVIMTMDKFLTNYDSIIGPSGKFLQSDLLDDSVIMIDEFDATKERILNQIIQRAVKIDVEYLTLFKTLYYNLNTREFSQISTDYLTEGLKKWQENLKERSAQIFDEYYLYYDYVSEERNTDMNNFMFHDGDFITEYVNEARFTRGIVDKEKKQVTITFSKSEAKEANEVEEISILSLMNGIFRFLTQVQKYAQTAAGRLVSAENGRRLHLETEMQFEDALHTIYHEMGLAQSQKELMMQELITRASSEKVSRRWDNVSQFYHSGFQLFEFADGDRHVHDTEIKYLRIQDIPEKIILHLANKACVVGFSATATIPSVLANYDLDYLKNKLGKAYKEGNDLLSQETIQKIDTFDKNYSESKANTKVIPFNVTLEQKSIKQRLEIILQNSPLSDWKKVIKNWAIEIKAKAYQSDEGEKGKKREDVVNKYLDMIHLYDNYLKTGEIYSLLALNMAFPRKEYAPFDLEFLEETFATLKKAHQADASMIVLKSENFEKSKSAILKKLSQGERVLVMSTYQTIGAGQNLQYAVPKKVSVVDLPPFHPIENKADEKDFDALYLGEITHVVTNIKTEKKLEQESIMNYFMEIEYLYHTGEITHHDHQLAIKAGMQRISGQKKNIRYPQTNILSSTSGLNKQMQMVIQAVGRLTRSHIKPLTTYIFISQKLLYQLANATCEIKQPAPEMAELLKICRNESQWKSLKEKRAHEELQKKEIMADRATKNMLRLSSLLRKGYRDKEDLKQRWEEVRRVILQKPVVGLTDFQKDVFLQTYYFETEGANKYCLALPPKEKGQFEWDWSKTEYDLVYQPTLLKTRKGKDHIILEFSEPTSELKLFMKNEVIRTYFESKGYATSFADERFVMNPVMFLYFYRAALGEAAGTALLQSFGIETEEIRNLENFEFFDCQIGENMYIDFKNWLGTFDVPAEEYRNNVLKKLNEVGGKKAVIINIFERDEQHLVQSAANNRIVTIPFLINHQGKVSEKMKKRLLEAIYEN